MLRPTNLTANLNCGGPGSLIWLTNIDSDVLFSRDRLSAGIQRLANLHFNTYLSYRMELGLYPLSQCCG